MLDLTLDASFRSYLASLIESGSESVRSPGDLEHMVDLLTAVFESSDIDPAWPGEGVWPLGVTLDAQNRDAWAETAGPLAAEIRETLAALVRVQAANDTSEYGHPELDAVSAAVAAYLQEPADILATLAALIDREGPEGLATGPGMQALGAWFHAGWDRREEAARQLLDAILVMRIPTDQALIDLINGAFPDLGLASLG